jgi:hypothetical protein
MENKPAKNGYDVEEWPASLVEYAREYARRLEAFVSARNPVADAEAAAAAIEASGMYVITRGELFDALSSAIREDMIRAGLGPFIYVQYAEAAAAFYGMPQFAKYLDAFLKALDAAMARRGRYVVDALPSYIQALGLNASNGGEALLAARGNPIVRLYLPGP